MKMLMMYDGVSCMYAILDWYDSGSAWRRAYITPLALRCHRHTAAQQRRRTPQEQFAIRRVQIKIVASMCVCLWLGLCYDDYFRQWYFRTFNLAMPGFECSLFCRQKLRYAAVPYSL